jgi:hypothetical protein
MIFYRPTFQYLKFVPIILISRHIRNKDRILNFVTKEQNIYPPQYYNCKHVCIGSGKGFLLRYTLTNIVYNSPPPPILPSSPSLLYRCMSPPHHDVRKSGGKVLYILNSCTSCRSQASFQLQPP